MSELYFEAFKRYMDVYFKERDFERLKELVCCRTTGFGTGIDEIISCEEIEEPQGCGMLELYGRDIEHAPNPVDYTITSMDVTELSKGAAIVMATVNIATTILSQEVRLNGLRMSIAFSETEKGLMIRHIHISFPTEVHEEGEAYPLKELEDRMQVIDRILRERTKTLDEAYAELAKMVNTDKLTGLASRIHLDEVLESELQRFNRYGSTFAIVFFDVDRFKEINDRLGHDFGDVVLKEVAMLSKKHARETDVVGRWGGDEFFVILPESSEDRARAYSKDLMTSLEQLEPHEGVSISISVGTATVMADDTLERLFKRVDQAMYRSKSLGGNRISGNA